MPTADSRKLSKRTEKVTKAQVSQMIKSIVDKDLTKKFILTATGTTITPVGISNSGTVYNLESIAQGASNQQRIGNNAIVQRVKYDGNLYPDSTDVINVFRVVLVRWNDNTSLVAGDIFQSTNYSTSYYNIDNIHTGKLQVLYDQSFCTGYTSSGAKHCHFDLKMNHPIQWNSASAVPAIQGSLNLFIVSDSTAVPSPTIAGNATVVLEQ